MTGAGDLDKAAGKIIKTQIEKFNDFVGKLGYLEELQHKYNLAYGIKTSEPEKLYQKLDEQEAFDSIKNSYSILIEEKAKKERLLAITSQVDNIDTEILDKRG